MELLQEVLHLKDLLSKDELIIDVKEKENAMLNDEYTQGLMFKYQQAMSYYNDAVRYHLNLESYQNDLSKTKEELYSSKLVKEYLEALKKANDYLNEIKEKLFEDVIDLKAKGKTCSL